MKKAMLVHLEDSVLEKMNLTEVILV